MSFNDQDGHLADRSDPNRCAGKRSNLRVICTLAEVERARVGVLFKAKGLATG